MNLKSCTNVATNRYQLEIEVDAQAFEDALNRAYLKDKKNISLPGFRKGKAPVLSLRNTMEKKYSMRMQSTMYIQLLWKRQLLRQSWI